MRGFRRNKDLQHKLRGRAIWLDCSASLGYVPVHTTYTTKNHHFEKVPLLGCTGILFFRRYGGSSILCVVHPPHAVLGSLDVLLLCSQILPRRPQITRAAGSALRGHHLSKPYAKFCISIYPLCLFAHLPVCPFNCRY
jgi:hypothetical protein